MEDKQQLLFTAVVLALIGTASLYIYSASQGAQDLTISEIGQEDVGALVRTEGVVSHTASYGDTFSLTLKEKSGNSSLEVFASQKVIDALDDKDELIPGTTVQVKGRIESYQDQLSLKVTVPGELEIKERAYSSFTHIPSMLDRPQWYEGMRVKVRGNIDFLTVTENDTYMEISPLEEDSAVLGVKITDWTNEESSIVKGRPVVIRGTFTYDSYRGRWIVESSQVPEGH